MGLLDLVDLAINVNQSTQLHQTREQIKRLEMGSYQESMRKQVLEGLRNFVFTIGQNLKSFDQYIEEAPQPIYVTAKTIAWRFQDLGITQEVFIEFADKEYVQ